MAQGVLPGFSVLEVQEEKEWYHVVYGFEKFYSFRKADRAGLRMIVVQLANIGVRKQVLQSRFGIARSTIDRWLNVYQHEGAGALAKLRSGPDLKVNSSVRDYISALYTKTGKQYGYIKNIQSEVSALFGIEISRETVRQVLKNHTDIPEFGERQHIENPGGTIPEAAFTNSGKTVNKGAKIGDIHQGPSPAAEAAVFPGGVLMSLPLLANYEAEKMIPRDREKGSNGYCFLECFFSVFFLLMARMLKVEENIKLHDGPSSGGLIGRLRLPSLRTIRRNMGVMVEKTKGKLEKLRCRFAQLSLQGWEPGEPLYIDGHFMPYMGGEKTLKGYNSQRRLVEKGRMAYVVNTGAGKPIYEILSDGFDHYHDNISRLVDVLIHELGLERPTVVMDRGGFSEHLFATIEAKADFITWHLGQPKIPKQAKWEEIKIPVQSNRWNKPDFKAVMATQKVLVRGDANGKGHRRVFFVKRGEKISPAITCKKHATLRELVLALTRRWGAQENPFKELKADGYDCLHSYEKDKFSQSYLRLKDLDQNRMMENPEYKRLVTERRKLQGKRERMEGRKIIRSDKKEKKRKTAFTKKQKNKLQQIVSRLNKIERRLACLPKEIRRIDYIQNNEIIRLASDKKHYFDLMSFVAFAVRKDIANIIGPVYRNNRDIHQVVIKFLRMKATVCKKETETVVKFEAPSRAKEKAALVHLCETLTAMEGTSSLFAGKLVYCAT